MLTDAVVQGDCQEDERVCEAVVRHAVDARVEAQDGLERVGEGLLVPATGGERRNERFLAPRFRRASECIWSRVRDGDGLVHAVRVVARRLYQRPVDVERHQNVRHGCSL